MTFRRPCTPVCGMLALLGMLALSAPRPVSAQESYNIHFRSAQLSGQAGRSVTAQIDLDNTPEAVTGFSFGVRHDAAVLTLEAVAIGADLQAALGAGVAPDPRFYALDESPAGGAGFTVAIILGADSPGGAALPAGGGHAIYSARYQIAAAATGTTQIEITGDLGQPPVPVVLDLKGVSKLPTGTPVTTATVSVTEGAAPFLRGDVNQSGRLDVTDAVLIFDYLFQGSSLPAGDATRANCLIALNVDGSISSGDMSQEDESDIEITDPIVLLRYVFPGLGDPPPPAAPFPDCGQPSAGASDRMACTAFLCK